MVVVGVRFGEKRETGIRFSVPDFLPDFSPNRAAGVSLRARAWLGHIAHYFAPSGARRLLSRVHDALLPDGVIVLEEDLADDGRCKDECPLLARISHQEPAGGEANARPQGCRGAIHRARLPTYCTLGDVHKLLPRAVAAGPFASSTAGRGEKCGLESIACPNRPRRKAILAKSKKRSDIFRRSNLYISVGVLVCLAARGRSEGREKSGTASQFASV